MTVGIRHDDLRKRNRALVIGAVRSMGRPSRTEIAASTRLSHSTISAIAADLIAEGILVETKPGDGAATKRGRPQVALGMNHDAATVVTLVLSLNALSCGLVDYAGNVVWSETRRIPTLSIGKEDLIAAVNRAAADMLARMSGRRRPVRVAFAVQGITDASGRTLLWTPITPHSDIPFADILEKAFGIPVTVENDCNMIAVALRWRLPDRFRDDFFTVLLSNGIGMGIMVKSRLFKGTHSSGGEFGHMIHIPEGALCRCGRRGCIEAYSGNYAVWREVHGSGDDDMPPSDIGDTEMQALAEAARTADGPERAAFQRAGSALGYGLGSLFAIFDPAPVAFVGPGALAFDVIEPAIRDAIARTSGGQHTAPITFETEPDEKPLIRDGCAMTALTELDQQLFANGAAGVDRSTREVVA